MNGTITVRLVGSCTTPRSENTASNSLVIQSTSSLTRPGSTRYPKVSKNRFCCSVSCMMFVSFSRLMRSSDDIRSPGQPGEGMFDPPLDMLEEACGGCTVEDTMVECQAQRQHFSYGDFLSRFVDHHESRHDAANPQDGAFRQIDDRREGVD